MSSVLGGKQTASVEMPAWAQQASQEAIQMAREAGRIGYMPNYGPQVAALSAPQEMAMQNNYDAAAAFGMAPQGGDALAGMPEAQTFAGGVRGYSSAPLFEQAVREFEMRNPQQAAQYNQFFVPRGQGSQPSYPTGQPSMFASPTYPGGGESWMDMVGSNRA